jgi:2C-methyl-D-erythritol 2,4-cyclodiphosphate synthase
MTKKTLLQNVATSIDDHMYLQFYVDVECIVFAPKVGKKIKAVVNKLGETYVG